MNLGVDAGLDGGSDAGNPCPPGSVLFDGYCMGLCASAVLCVCSDETEIAVSCPVDPSMACGVVCTGHGGVSTGRDGGSDAGATDAGPHLETCDAGDIAPGDRVITVSSQCAGQTVAVGVNGGYVQDCATDGSCPTGTTCLTSRSPPGCFWEFPAPSCGSPTLNSGDSVTYVLDAPAINYVIPNGPAAGQTFPVKWSGNLYASTQCAANGTGCETAVCSISENGMNSLQACADGVGPQGPVTLAEFTLSPEGVDFYDISVINGVNIPIAMAPVGGVPDMQNPYTCLEAGSDSRSTTGLPACSWSFNPLIPLDGATTDQTALLRAVTPGGAMCLSDSDCTSGAVCGSALDFGSTTVAQSCGQQIGWWTADELCGFTGNTMGAPVSCEAAVSGQGTNVDLYHCSGANPNSCYNSGAANATCCGCPEWDIDGTSLPIPSGFQCYATNPSWQSIAEPWAASVKDACPTAYSFPFDDATSTFTCATANPSAMNPNSMGYIVTLCPGGKNGI